MDSYKIVYEGGTGEISEKKSRFIGTAKPVSTENEATLFIEQIKKKYWDAGHNCFAYVIGHGDTIERCSDDGEPAKTAGRPMLDILLAEGIYNTAIVVTRYFGGTLLGTGGLVRAYQAAAKAALNQCRIVEKCYGLKLLVTTDYQGIGKIQFIAGQYEIPLLDSEYTDIVKATLLVSREQEACICKKIQEATNGKAMLQVLQEVYYAKDQKELLIFDT